jgi:hypothetical protein
MGLDNTKTTVIMHIYNEEYLLPFWLEHHKPMFDHGIIIDYGSTDSSLSIISSLCPTWDIRRSRNSVFDAKLIDSEVMDIESTVVGFKIALNVTEFLLHTEDFMKNISQQPICFAIPMVKALSSNDNYHPTTLKEFFGGIENIGITRWLRGTHRFIHNFSNGGYGTGRHSVSMPFSYTNDACVVWVGMYPLNSRTMARKLQIKSKMSEHDKLHNFGAQHLLSELQINVEKERLLHTSLKLCDLPNTLKRCVLKYIN